MNDLIESNEKEITISDIFKSYSNNAGRIFLYFLIPLLIFLSIFFYVKPYEDKEKIVALNIIFQEDIISSDISKSYLFNKSHLSEALIRSGLSDKVEVNRKLINAFDLISGHHDLNKIVDDFVTRDFITLTKQLYFKPEEIENLRKDLIAKANTFKTIIFKSSTFKLSDYEVSILISNLIDVINENIAIEYDLANIKLKEIQELNLSSPISTMDINKLNDRLILLRNYIEILNKDFGSFAPDINLDIYLSNLESLEDIFNYLIQENQVYRDVVESRILLDIEGLSKSIFVLETQLGKLSISEKNSTNENAALSQPSTLNVDASFIDTILSLGSSVSSLEDKKDFLDRINTFETSKINLERRLAGLDLKTNFAVTAAEAKDYLINSLNDTTKQINLYIQNIRDVKIKSSPIAKLSYSNTISDTYLSSNLLSLIYIFIGSICISLLFVTLRIFMHGFNSR
tara:strand:+ start:31091 stop:32464 length:1374 start_codon:yes stop_codon:yes gene_type:complete